MSNSNSQRLRQCQKLIGAFEKGVIQHEELYSNLMACFISPGITQDFEAELWEKSLSDLSKDVQVTFRRWAQRKGRQEICRGIARMNSVDPEDNTLVDRRCLQISPALDRLTDFLAMRQEVSAG